MGKSKYFFLNGHEYVTNSELTILEIVNYFNYNTSLLVLEYNSLICNKKIGTKFILKIMIKLNL
jgi:hypothetical protein